MNNLLTLFTCAVAALLGATLPSIAYAWIARTTGTRPAESLAVRIACAVIACAVWLGLWLRYCGQLPWFLLYANASLVLVCCSLVDLHVWLIPDEFLAYGACTSFLLIMLGHAGQLLANLLTAAMAGLFFGATSLLSRGGLGFGDVKMSAMLGLVLGPAGSLLAFMIAVVSGAAFGLVLLLLRRAALKQRIAFGPFLALGGIASMLWGELILTWYLQWAGIVPLY